MMRCINCDIATLRLRRHNTSSLPSLLRDILAEWLTIEVPLDANICHQCFELLSSARAHKKRRLLGHRMLCITCGRALKNSQRHTVERNSLMFKTLSRSHPAFQEYMNYVCYPCWMRHQRHMKKNAKKIYNNPGPEPRTKPEHFIQVKEECNDKPDLLALERNVKIEPVDIKLEINKDIDDGPSEKYIEAPLKNEYDNYIEINENELIPNVKVKDD